MERMGAGPRAAVWTAGAIPVLALAHADWTRSIGGKIADGELWGRDFINLWAGGGLVRARDFATLYDPARYATHLESLFGPLDRHLYSYPPTAFPIGDLFGRLPYVPALLVWTLGTAALFAWAARPWLPGRRAWLAVATPAALLSVWEGQYGFLVGALWLGAFGLLDRRPVAAGALIGLLAIKPQYAVLLPLVLLLRRDWRAIASAAASATATVAASLLLYGAAAWQTFFDATAGRQVEQIDAGGRFFGKMSASAATALLELGAGWPAALFAQGALGVLGLGLLVLAIRRGASTHAQALLAATATFLFLPYSLNYDLTVVAIGAWVAATGPGATPATRVMALAGFLAPTLGLMLAMAGWPVTPVLLAGLMVAQYRTAVSGRAAPASAAAARSAG